MTNTSGSNRLFPRLILLLALLTATVTRAEASASRHSSWLPADGAPVPRFEPDGVTVFPCEFTPQNDRCAWDTPSPPALDSAHRLELTLSCDSPALLRGFTVYLRSGKGWYAAVVPVPATSPVSISLTPASFQDEGQPEGWNRIDAIRLAAWKRSAGSAGVRLHALKAVRDRVFVIRADESAPTGESPVADALARRASSWLTRAGIGHTLIAEKEWIRLSPGETRFAILPYNPMPQPPFLKALDDVLDKGGKLLVCYGASPLLAARMGFQLQSYKAAPNPIYWNAYRFDPPIGPVGPVFQESANLIPVLPQSPDARVLAWWEAADGSRTDPAWLASPAGYWTTHTLEAQDSARKTRVLLEWIGEAAPEAWEQAGRAALARASATLAADALAPLRQMAADGKWKELVDEAPRRLLAGAIRKAAALPPAPDTESSAAWAQPGPGLLPADWPRAGAALRQAGIRRLYLSAVAFGRCHGESKAWPRSEMAGFVADPFGESLTAATRAGLSVHAWITCFNVAYTPPATLAAWRKAGRLMVTPAGEQPWLTPAHPDNVALLLDGIAELASRYPVDGIHLDYVRTSDSGLDISPCALKAFETATGEPLKAGAADVLPGGARHDAYAQWLTGTIDAFVRDVRKRVRAVRPGLTVSAAVYPAYPYCRDGVQQDWKTWLEKGYVDEVCTMSYTADLAEFRAYIEAYKAMPGWGTRLHPGIGVYSDSAPLSPDAVVDQVETVRKAGGAGVVFFLANREFLRDLPPVLQPALD